MAELRTERLVLRRWTDSDRPAFRRLNSDPKVMATIGPVMTYKQSDSFMDFIEQRFDQHGFGLWCLDLEGEALGFTGLLRPRWCDGIEIGWRIRSSFWGRGFATEGAIAVLADAFGELGIDEVISFTATVNEKSLRVMRKIGLRHDPEGDFDHPNVAEGSPLRPHVLYRLTVDEYRQSESE